MILERAADLRVGETAVFTLDWADETKRLDTTVQTATWAVDGPLTIVSSSLVGDEARVRVSANAGAGEARLRCTATMADGVHVLIGVILVSVRALP